LRRSGTPGLLYKADTGQDICDVRIGPLADIRPLPLYLLKATIGRAIGMPAGGHDRPSCFASEALLRGLRDYFERPQV